MSSSPEPIARHELVFAADALVRLFQSEQKKSPVVLVVGVHGSTLAQTVYNAGAQHVILCDANPEHTKNILWDGVDENRITVTQQHTLRLGSILRVDVVILDLFSSTINRWAPVHLMRDLFKRGIIRTFPGRGAYVCPTRAAMCLRVYESPTYYSAPGPEPLKRVRWQHAAALTDTDLYTPVSARVEVLHEQYDQPAQTWPPVIHVECPRTDAANLVAVLEWTVQLLPTITMSHLVQRGTGHAPHAVRLCRVGVDHFPWADVARHGAPVSFANSPRSCGGIGLTAAVPPATPSADVSLSLAKMDGAIERWFGDLVAQSNAF